ncbi:phenylacetate-CoA ligase [Anaerobacterium chartisolvens]|uniref:Phenylacetate-CoA ligase n=1 Tax=Anaerobacterium chartisolvens TaxID=1297424 RepID=A0A369BHC9_9FIRM|nr:AMP-binding protein [Anaerobacterium chartisolvens]RCX20960.1 phenylacetate-CoA ligase [Anaerobacterium chartisolvens]
MDIKDTYFAGSGNIPEIIKRHFSEDRLVEYWDSKRIKEYTTDAVRDLLQHVYKNNAFYRKKIQAAGIDTENFNDLKKLKLLDFVQKEDLQNEPYLILSVEIDKIVQFFLSTGTTQSKTIYMMYTLDDLYIRDLAPDMRKLVPIDSADVVINALPYEMSSAGLSFHRILQNAKRAGVVSVGKGGYYSDPKKTLMAMKELRANVMFTSPSYAMYLAETAEGMGMDIKKECRLKIMWITGEGCSNAFRNRIEELWGCPAYSYYGSLECGPLGIECEEKDGYHITEGHVYVEIVDRNTGKTLEPGEIGEIVVTTLLREGAPLIRYATQDMGYIEDVPCECGVKFKKIHLRGRSIDQISIDGKQYSPYYVEEFLMRNEEVGNNYRLIVYDDHLLIETNCSSRYKDVKGLEEKIANKVEYGCGIPTRVKFVEPIPYLGGKVIRVINKQTKNK